MTNLSREPGDSVVRMKKGLEHILQEKGPIARVGVVGMGYVGIPSAVLFAGSGAFREVIGFQRDSPSSGYKIGMLNRGESPLKGEEPDLGEMLARVVAQGTFRCTSDFSLIRDSDAVTLAIQTPFRDPADLIPDSTPLHEGLASVGRNLSQGTLVVIESTVTPGTTGGAARRILERESGLVAGRDFALAHAPERVMAGRLLRNIREHDRVVGGIDPASTSRASELYRTVLTSGKIPPHDGPRSRDHEDLGECLPRPPDRRCKPARALLRGLGGELLRRAGRDREPEGRGGHESVSSTRGRGWGGIVFPKTPTTLSGV